jgi:hypothetical protein
VYIPVALSNGVDTSPFSMVDFEGVTEGFEIIANDTTSFFANFDSSVTTDTIQSPNDLLGEVALIIYRLSALNGIIEMFINGNLVSSGNYDGTFADDPDIGLGADLDIANNMECQWAELGVYPRAISDSEVKALTNYLILKWK